MTDVLIVGAGIGGLTTALSLHHAGIRCALVDRVSELAPLGVGINLQPHAVRELTELGLGDELAAIGVPTAELIHYDRHGNRIWGEPRGLAAGYRWPQYSVHRGELQMLLLRAVRDRLGPHAVVTGTALESLREDEAADVVVATLRDRVTGEVRREPANVVIGADGLYSAVRAHLHPDEGPPVGSGIRMWRGTARCAPFLTGRTMIMAGCNSVAKFVAYPISPTVDDVATVNWVAEVAAPDDARPANWTAAGRLDEVLPHYADWNFRWLDVPELIRGSERILEYPMVDRDPLDRWGTSRITLLGDAAHPMYPIGSNGGSQAVVDARVLAWHLASAPDAPTALARYEADRREPTAAVVLANRALGPERILRTVAERAPDGFARVEDVLSAPELEEIAAAYRRTTSSDVAALNSRPSWTPVIATNTGGTR